MLAAAMLALLACSHSHDAAQRLIEDVDLAVLAAGPDAVKYAPDELADIEHRLGALQSAFDRGDYRNVLESGQAVLLEARGLGRVAAAHKTDSEHALTQRWSSLGQRLPEQLALLERQLEAPPHPVTASRHAVPRAAPGAPTLTPAQRVSAQASLADARTLWSKAQGAFANGNLNEAVTTAGDVEARLRALAAELGIPLEPAPDAGDPASAAPATAPSAAAPR